MRRRRIHGIQGEPSQAVREAAQDKCGAGAQVDGVGFAKSVKRVYPMKAMAGPVLGFTNVDGGQDGLESQLDDLLKGRLGSETMVKDAMRRTLLIEEKGYKPAGNGCNVWLTLDTVIQDIAEDELTKACLKFKAASGTAIILDPHTGRVLAMANWPSYDPNDYQHATPLARRNKAFDPYEPGSVFKPFMVSKAIENHVVTPATIFDCHGGRWTDPTGRLVTDHGGYGELSVEDIIVKSSNIGAAQIVENGHPDAARRGAGIRVWRADGNRMSRRRKRHRDLAGEVEQGHADLGEFRVRGRHTPLQLVRAYATFANGGYLVTPRIIGGVEVSPGRTTSWEELAGPASRSRY